MKIKWRDQNDGRNQEFSDLSGERNTEPSLTVQSQAQEADINWIVKTYGATGQLPTTVAIPEYGDYSEIGDYRSALDAVRRAQEDFMKLPAQTRSHFENDPQAFLEACSDLSRREEMVKLGLKLPEPLAKPPDKPLQDEKATSGTT